MRRECLIILCAFLLGMSSVGYAARANMKNAAPCIAWWSLLYERPNPDRLPVRVHFLWAKGLE